MFVVLLILALLDAEHRWGFLVGMAGAVLVAAAFVWSFQTWNAGNAQIQLQRLIGSLPRPAIRATSSA